MWNSETLPALQSALLAWYREEARPLPWRVHASLYRTVVSEFMCQQTQIDTVLPYFARWMARFPDFATLAAAPESAVLKAWEGLGYYSRARNLHRLAKDISQREILPCTPDEWRRLPGIGPYTAAAVSSINNGFPAAVVDGNVIRILARLTADKRSFKGNAEAVKTFQPLADELLNASTPGDHNQAMMELGATVCLKARPLCLLCPVRPWCAGSRTGKPEDFPKLIRRKTEKLTVPRLFLVAGNKLLLERTASHSRRLADMAELPRAKKFPAETHGRLLATRRRGISHQQITEPIHSAADSSLVRAVVAKRPESFFWQPLDELDAVTISGPHRRWIGELLSEAG